MSDTWTISVNGRTYGPYTEPQMRAFAEEGRLAAHSLVSRAGEDRYQAASADSELAKLFRPVPARPAFFTAEGDAAPQNFGRKEEETSTERTHYIIVADMKSRSISGLEEEIFNFGPAYPVMPQAWVVSSDMPITAIRNALVQKLGKLDTLFVADATHNKAAWFNFGPEADSRIRRIWQKVPEAPAQRAAG
ncbi:MAG: DUF4339 domain-containing protein [Alphaproteobacteria bacterium]|nr:DUF4339 domain-containing protein [Alphaproteobacteria bacterium]MDE2110672.1 DUF4339 domain-containing protein [Alphaproteobacteria bacterium]MDE2494477.1 DUF4339 domain-containing protein [Alphaproteobacteria bacterium]